jgi:rRNA pseudouridine-1189 N-methylase Emg1 (Nep1/Mra1 family)
MEMVCYSLENLKLKVDSNLCKSKLFLFYFHTFIDIMITLNPLLCFHMLLLNFFDTLSDLLQVPVLVR